MAKVKNNLDKRYDEYIELLTTLCEVYDSGAEIVSLSISVAIRVLVHDTEKSTSLLSHLGRKNISFVSTNNYDSKGKIHLGLVRQINVGVTDGRGGEAKYWPNCDERYFPSLDKKQLFGFDFWWNDEEVFRSGDSSLSRKALVLSVANKDGGAHFDADVEKKYDEFRHNWSGRSTLVGRTSGNARGYDNIPTYPAIRQIGHELLCSLK